MNEILTINGYPIGWSWLKSVPLEDFNWLLEVFTTMTDNVDTYNFATLDINDTNREPPYPIIDINREGLANFGHMFCEPNSQYNKLLRTQNKLKQKRK